VQTFFDFLLFCREILICLWLPNLIVIIGGLFCGAVLANLGMGTGEEDEPSENIGASTQSEIELTWLGMPARENK